MNESIELRHLRYFLAVAEELHFGRAAKRLHIAQPPLSQQIKQLEEFLGNPLFLRNSRMVSLTKAGEVFAQRCRLTLARMQEDFDLVKRVGRGELGTLCVGFIESAMLTRFPSLIEEYRANYPDVMLKLQEFNTASLVDATLEGRVDVGIARDGNPTEGLIVERLFEERFVAVLPENHSLAKRKQLKVQELKNEPFVLFPREMGPLAWDRTVALCEKEGFHPRIVQEAPRWLTAMRLVGAGLGITIAPACVSTIVVPGIVCKVLAPCLVKSEIGLVYRSEVLDPIVESFIAVARKRLKQ